jgi:hypothetical protein
MVSHCVEIEVEEVALNGRTLEAEPPQQQKPRRMGMLRKNKEARENQILIESCARSVVEELLMCIIWLEPIETTSRGGRSKMRRTNAMGSNI